jgi:hypothetical protein
MQTLQPVYTKRCEEDAGTKILHFYLQGILSPGQKLALNLETRTLSLLSNGPELIVERQLSINEMHIAIPLLEAFPHYSPYEVLLSHLYSKTVTETSIARCYQRLQEAQDNGTWQQELRPIRRALSSLRTKLRQFDLEISNIRERGCSLAGLTVKPIPKTRN